jgi:hypothetical protein
MAGLVLENLLDKISPKLFGDISGDLVGVGLGVAKLGAERYKSAKSKSIKKQEVAGYNRSLAWEGKEKKKLIGKYGEEIKSEARANLAVSGVREGTYDYAVSGFVKNEQAKVQQNIDSRTAYIKKSKTHNVFQAAAKVLGLKKDNVQVRYGITGNPKGYYKPF